MGSSYTIINDTEHDIWVKAGSYDRIFLVPIVAGAVAVATFGVGLAVIGVGGAVVAGVAVLA